MLTRPLQMMRVMGLVMIRLALAGLVLSMPVEARAGASIVHPHSAIEYLSGGQGHWHSHRVSPWLVEGVVGVEGATDFGERPGEASESWERQGSPRLEAPSSPGERSQGQAMLPVSGSMLQETGGGRRLDEASWFSLVITPERPPPR